MTFEERLARLEIIVAELQASDVDLARALTLFEEGVACLREASAELTAAQSTVQRLVERNGEFRVVDTRD